MHIALHFRLCERQKRSTQEQLESKNHLLLLSTEDYLDKQKSANSAGPRCREWENSSVLHQTELFSCECSRVKPTTTWSSEGDRNRCAPLIAGRQDESFDNTTTLAFLRSTKRQCSCPCLPLCSCCRVKMFAHGRRKEPGFSMLLSIPLGRKGSSIFARSTGALRHRTKLFPLELSAESCVHGHEEQLGFGVLVRIRSSAKDLADRDVTTAQRRIERDILNRSAERATRAEERSPLIGSGSSKRPGASSSEASWASSCRWSKSERVTSSRK